MIWLAIGVLLWSGLHLMKVIAIPLRQRLIDKIGEGPWKGMFSLAIVASIVLMVLGWRASPVIELYSPLEKSGIITMMIMFVSLQLFARSSFRSNTKRFIRNSQMTGTILWSIAHLIMNGDAASLILFGGLGIWALLEIILLNRRDGRWEKPAAIPASRELMPTLVGAVMFAVLFAVHGYISGVSLF